MRSTTVKMVCFLPYSEEAFHCRFVYTPGCGATWVRSIGTWDPPEPELFELATVRLNGTDIFPFISEKVQEELEQYARAHYEPEPREYEREDRT